MRVLTFSNSNKYRVSNGGSTAVDALRRRGIRATYMSKGIDRASCLSTRQSLPRCPDGRLLGGV